MGNQPRAANVVAKTEVVCLRIDREDFERHLGPCKVRPPARCDPRVLVGFRAQRGFRVSLWFMTWPGLQGSRALRSSSVDQ